MDHRRRKKKIFAPTSNFFPRGSVQTAWAWLRPLTGFSHVVICRCARRHPDRDLHGSVAAAPHSCGRPFGEGLGLSGLQIRAEPSPQASACAKTAWIIAVNKPVFPLYVWYFTGSGLWAASVTAITLPLYVGLALLLRSNLTTLRLGTPLLGLCDTVLAVKLFGAASGAELFFFPCLMLATLAAEAGETRTSRALVATIFLVAIALHGHYGAPLHLWSADALERLREVNIFSVASLCAFLGWTFAERLRLPSVQADNDLPSLGQ
jgi:hypothetical protein